MTDRGYDVLTCPSNWVNTDDKKLFPGPIPQGRNFPQDRESIGWFHDFVDSQIVAKEHFAGAMVAPWHVLRADKLFYWQSAIDQLADAMEKHGWKS